MSQNNTHHGGAWKVAYADFVTAMMALFMVLWLTSQDTEMRKELAQYFQDPYNTPMDNSMGVIKNDSASGQSTEGQRKGKANIDDIKVLHDMAQEFMRLLNIDNVNPSDDPVEIETTSDGLRVTLYDRDAHPFFVENAADFTPWGKFVIEQMSWLVQRHFFSVRVDGHVAAGFNATETYSAWDLSSDRAQGTRKLLEYYGVMDEQFVSVTAHGTRDPLPWVHKTDEANDRVSISLVLTETFNKADVIFEKGWDRDIKPIH